MIKLLIAFFVVAASLIYLQSIPGEVSVDFDGTFYQVSFFWAGTLILAGFSGLILLIVVLNFVLDLPKIIRNIFTMRQNAKSRDDLQKSFSQLMLGNFSVAEKLALKRIHYSKTPGIHLLLAASSLYKDGKIDLAEKYLNQASYFLKDEDDLLAFESFKAAMRIDGGYLSHAQSILEDLTLKESRNPYLLDNLIKVYTNQKNYTKAYQLLPKIKKAKVYDDEKYQELEANITRLKLESVMYSENLIQFTEFWNTISRHQKNVFSVKLQYFLGLVYLDGFKGKENLFNRFVFSHFQSQAIWQFLYNHPLLATKLNREKAKRLIANQPASLANVVLAKSYFDSDQFDEAINIAEQCAKTWQQIPVWKVLAEIYEGRNDHEKALQCYRIIHQKEQTDEDKKLKIIKSGSQRDDEKDLISLTWMGEEKAEQEPKKAGLLENLFQFKKDKD